MKKIIIIVLLLLMMSSVCNGAVSEDMSVYVRKDVYEAHQQSMNTKLDMILEQMREFKEEQKAQRRDINELSNNVTRLSERIDGVNASLSERIDGLNAALSGRMDGLDKRMDSLDKRIDDLRNGIYLWLVAVGVVIAWPKVSEKFQNWRKSQPSITLEDVRRLIEENNAKLQGKPQV